MSAGPDLLDPVEAERRRALAVAEADVAFVAQQRAAMGLGDEAEAKLAERREIEDARRRHRELFGDTASPVDHNLPLPERENRKARRAKAALDRLALPKARRGRRAGGRAAGALIAAQAPGKIGKD